MLWPLPSAVVGALSVSAETIDSFANTRDNGSSVSVTAQSERRLV